MVAWQAIIADENWVDRPTAVLTAGSEVNALPIGNVTDPVVVKKWRTDGTVESFAVVDFGAALEVQLLLLAGCTMRGSDTVRHRLDVSAAGVGSVLDVNPFLKVIDGYGYHVFILDEPVTARYWHCEILAPSLEETTYFEVGRMWAGPIIQPSRNIDMGFARAWDDGSRITTAEQSRAEYVDEGARQRRWDFAFNLLTKEEADLVEDFQRRSGLSKQVVCVIDPTADDLGRRVILGRVETTVPIVHSAHPTHARTFTIRESI